MIAETVEEAVWFRFLRRYGNRNVEGEKTADVRHTDMSVGPGTVRRTDESQERSNGWGLMKLKYTAAWVGLTAAAMVTATACGSEGAKTAAETADKAVDKADTIMAALTRATDRTEELGSAEVRTTTELGTGEPIAMDGTYSWGDGYALDVEMDTEAAQMQELTDSPTVRTLFVDGAYYYDIDPQPAGPLAGKEWMKIDGSAVFGESGAATMAGGGGEGSPADSMKGLKYASDVDDLGKETVNGKSATHYRAVLDEQDLGKFKEVFKGDDSMLNSATGDGSITMEIWVGAKDLPVRLKQDFGAMTVTMDFDKWGATKDIVAPPADQVGDLTQEVKDAGLQQG
ncbi:putative lipoprotein [Streptomyces tendae]|nr:putative lipoprotein [Streptomyces tendae]